MRHSCGTLKLRWRHCIVPLHGRCHALPPRSLEGESSPPNITRPSTRAQGAPRVLAMMSSCKACNAGSVVVACLCAARRLNDYVKTARQVAAVLSAHRSWIVCLPPCSSILSYIHYSTTKSAQELTLTPCIFCDDMFQKL